MGYANLMSKNTAYFEELNALLRKSWPDNRAINLVSHGHSVPAGYIATPLVKTFESYPHLLHRGLHERFPFAVINMIVTAIGSENSEQGRARFESEVLNHRPDVILIDYGLNDRGIGLERAAQSWRAMIEAALQTNAKVILLTPTSDSTQRTAATSDERAPLQQHAAQIRDLAAEYEVALADSLAAFENYDGELSDLMGWGNHPNLLGHQLVARELMRWFRYF